MSSDELQSASLLVFANKSDMPGALPSGDLATKLGLSKLSNRHW